MFGIQRIKIRSYEVGLKFREGEFQGLIGAGTHWRFDLFGKERVEVVSRRDPWLRHEKLDVLVRSGKLGDQAHVIDLKDYERALVWIDGRFSVVLAPGLYVYWSGAKDVRVEIVDARTVRFEHASLKAIVRTSGVERHVNVHQIDAEHLGVLLIDGKFIDTLPAGEYVFWKDVAKVTLHDVDLRERMLDISGQELMTADKVTLRLNAVVTYRVSDARRAVTAAEDLRQALYRDAQLALRAIVGTRELDAFLTEKDAVAEEIEAQIKRHSAVLGVEIVSLGIRDVILPGEMKDLMNKVTEAKKAAEANLIVRREETAAMRSQVNTARLLADNPTLMRIRELEVLEKIAATSKMSVVLGERGLADRVINLL